MTKKQLPTAIWDQVAVSPARPFKFFACHFFKPLHNVGRNLSHPNAQKFVRIMFGLGGFLIQGRWIGRYRFWGRVKQVAGPTKIDINAIARKGAEVYG